jgi:hypothetical protein
MIVTGLSGGLGNQLFQYAVAVALRQRIGGRIKLDLGWFETTKREQFRLDAFCVEADILTPGDLAQMDHGEWRGTRHWIRKSTRTGLARLNLCAAPVTVRTISDERVHTPDFTNVRPGAYRLVGTWQYPSLLKDVRSDLRKALTPRVKLSPVALYWMDVIKRLPSVAIHVRRGDTVSNPVYAFKIATLKSEYYVEAIKVMRARVPEVRFVVFSDEPDWVRDNVPELSHSEFMDDLSLEPHEVLELMKACRHFVIANSTLSWWAAWLKEKDDTVVVSPGRWFRDTAGGWKNLSLSNWTELDV